MKTIYVIVSRFLKKDKDSELLFNHYGIEDGILFINGNEICQGNKDAINMTKRFEEITERNADYDSIKAELELRNYKFFLLSSLKPVVVDDYDRICLFMHLGGNEKEPFLKKECLEIILADSEKYYIQPYSFGYEGDGYEKGKISHPGEYFNEVVPGTQALLQYLKQEFQQETNPDNQYYFTPQYIDVSKEKLYRQSFDDLVGECNSQTKPIIFQGTESLEELRKESEKFDDRWQYLDSSIWLRYQCNKEEVVVREFEENKTNQLYDLVIAQEFYRYQQALLNFPLVEHSGQKLVIPFTFHSEAKMKKLAGEEVLLLKDLSWRIIVVDDYSNKFPGRPSGKLAIIKSLVEKLTLPLNITIKWDTAENLSEAKDKIFPQSTGERHEEHDLILLDYLFLPQKKVADLHSLENEKKIDWSENRSEIEYGDDILDALRKEMPNTTGTFGKLWIMPISAYQNALIDKLREKGLETNEKYWIISEGADPVCTPHLFTYKLFHILRNQVERIAEIVNNKPVSKLENKLIDLADPQKDKFTIFPEIVELGTLFKQLSARKESSIFANMVIKKLFFGLEESDWNHLQNLIYYLCYGGNHQKGIILKEFFYFKRKNRHAVIVDLLEKITQSTNS